MPIKARIDMLSTGIRTPVGVKIFCDNLQQLESRAREVEAALRQVPGTASAYAERVNSGYFLEIEPDRLRAARYGLSIDDTQSTISTALGAETVTMTVEGRERYAAVIRYPRHQKRSGIYRIRGACVASQRRSHPAWRCGGDPPEADA